MPPHPTVSAVCLAYKAWEETVFPAASRRLGLPRVVVNKSWALGMSTDDLGTLRDASTVVFAYYLSGIRDSSVVSVATSDVRLTASGINDLLSFVKGKLASRESPISLHASYCGDGLLDLLHRWADRRGTHSRFFAMSEDAAFWRPGLLYDALLRVLHRVCHTAPAGCRYGAHSLRIRAHTVQFCSGYR